MPVSCWGQRGLWKILDLDLKIWGRKTEVGRDGLGFPVATVMNVMAFQHKQIQIT